MKRKKLFIKIISVVMSLSVFTTSNVLAQEPNNSDTDIPDVISASFENIDIVVDDGIAIVSGNVIAGNLNIPICSSVEFYEIVSSDTQNGKYIAYVLSSNDYKLINLSFGEPSTTMISKNQDLLLSDSVTRLAIFDEKNNRIFSAEQKSDFIILEKVKKLSQVATPSNDVYGNLILNETWYNQIIRQQLRAVRTFERVNVNEMENASENNANDYIDHPINAEDVRLAKSEYETLKTNNMSQNNDINSANELQVATVSPTVDDEIQPCVNYIGMKKFMTPDTIYERTPTSSDPTGYYMETLSFWGTICDKCIEQSVAHIVIDTYLIGYEIVSIAPNDDPSNSSFAHIRLNIIWSYWIKYDSCNNEIKLMCEASDFRLRNMRLAMNTDENNPEFFYRMIANSKTMKGCGAINNPTVDIALKVIPYGEYISLGINVWNGLYTFIENITANGTGTADITWPADLAAHQQHMLTLTGTSGVNRVVNVDCIQGFDDKWLALQGHYIYIDALVKQEGPETFKYMQYSYQFEICTQNSINYFYTIETVDDYFCKAYMR